MSFGILKLTLFLSLTVVFMNAQVIHFNGDYTSHKTSYWDINSEADSFIEEAVNNVFIHIEKDGGVFVFQDERLPRKLLSYKIDSFSDKIVDGDIEVLTYNCTRINSLKTKPEQIVLYVNRDGSLNIMISDTSSSQVFFDLKKQ